MTSGVQHYSQRAGVPPVCPQMTSGPETAHTVLHGELLQCDSSAQSACPALQGCAGWAVRALRLAGPKSASYCLVFSHKCPVSIWTASTPCPTFSALLHSNPQEVPADALHIPPPPSPPAIRAPVSSTVSILPQPNLSPRRPSLRAGCLENKASPPSLHVQAGPQEAVLKLQPERAELQSALPTASLRPFT